METQYFMENEYMRRLIAVFLMLSMILVSFAGCKADVLEDAASDEYVETEKEEQGSEDRPSSDEEQTPADGEAEQKEEDPNQPTKDEEQEKKEDEEKEPSKDEEKEPSKDEQKEPSKDEQKEPTKDEEKEPSKDEEKVPTQEDQKDEEEIPEDEEEFPEEDEVVDEEESDEEDPEDEGFDDSSSGSTTVTKPSSKPEPTPSRVKIASYNIKALMYGEDTEGIIQELREIDADIVGLQEVDKNTRRSGVKVHQVELLAKSLGYPYWSFDKLIDFQGGEYGMAILSRYPITSSSVVQYKDQEPKDSHIRKYGRHVLKVGSKNLAFYNTHLCIRDDNDSVSVLQLQEVTKRMQKDVYAVLTGDFNMPAGTMAKTLSKNKMLTLLNDGVGQIGKKDAAKYIDNIVVSNMMGYEVNDSGMAIEVSETEYSDHNLIYTYVSFK